MEDVLRYFTGVKVEIPQCRNTQLQAKVTYSKCYFGKSTKVFA